MCMHVCASVCAHIYRNWSWFMNYELNWTILWYAVVMFTNIPTLNKRHAFYSNRANTTCILGLCIWNQPMAKSVRSSPYKCRSEEEQGIYLTLSSAMNRFRMTSRPCSIMACHLSLPHGKVRSDAVEKPWVLNGRLFSIAQYCSVSINWIIRYQEISWLTDIRTYDFRYCEIQSSSYWQG